MTEVEWLACTDIQAMIDFVSRVGGRIQPPTVEHPYRDRPLRLFAVGCCRIRWAIFLDPDARTAVETAERFADGLVTREALRQAQTRATILQHRIFEDDIRDGRFAPGSDWHIRSASLFAAAEVSDDPVARAAARLDRSGSARRPTPWWFYSVNGVYRVIEATQGLPADLHHAPEQAGLLRCVMGNPCRPVAADAPWRSSTAVAMAAQMYDSRDFSAMPILADALQDAGCDDDVIIEHCRGGGPHVRGCHVIDLILGLS